jgi:hypothetical protein
VNAWAYVRTLLILAAGALFLFLPGSGQAYRSDEVWSLRTVSLPFPAMMAEIRGDIHPPLYYWLLAAWTRVFGTNEIVTRLLSMLMGLGAAAAVYVAGREWYGARGGLLAAVLFIASPLAGLSAQLVRMYALLALASAVSTLAFLRLSRYEHVGLAAWPLYLAANIVGSFTHVWFFFLLLAQGVTHVVFHRTERLARMGVAAAFSLAPYAALWLPVLIRQVRKTEDALAWVPTPGWADLAQTLFFLGGMFLFAAPFLWRWWKRGWIRKLPAAFPALIVVVTVLVPFALSYWKPVYWPRFTIVALPAFALAAAAFAPARSGYALETGILLAQCVLAAILNLQDTRCDSRRAAEYLATNTRDGDTVIYTSLSRLPIDYYWDQLQPRRQVAERSFPGAIDSHPGFEGLVDTPRTTELLREEAARLAGELERRDGTTVFFLHGFHPRTDALLERRLAERFAAIEPLGLNCLAMGGYFQFIRAYSRGEPPETKPQAQVNP